MGGGEEGFKTAPIAKDKQRSGDEEHEVRRADGQPERKREGVNKVRPHGNTQIDHSHHISWRVQVVPLCETCCWDIAKTLQMCV